MKKKKQKNTVEAPASTAPQIVLTNTPKSKTLLRFVVTFAILFLLFEACYFNETLYNHLFVPINKLFAFLAAKLLTLFGIAAVSQGESISNSSFSINVKQGCDSLEALAIFVCGVIAFPAHWRIKFNGLLIGTIIILGMNLLRIANLFWIGLYHHDLFDLFHLEIWQGFFIVLSIALWLIWVIKAIQPNNR